MIAILSLRVRLGASQSGSGVGIRLHKEMQQSLRPFAL